MLLSLLLSCGKLAAGGCTSTCGALRFECEVKAETLSCLAMPGGQQFLSHREKAIMYFEGWARVFTPQTHRQ